MSLDKQIKEMAAAELDSLVKLAQGNLTGTCKGTPLVAADVARLVSGHKTKTTYDACVKVLAARISANMLASIGNKEPGKDAG